MKQAYNNSQITCARHTRVPKRRSSGASQHDVNTAAYLLLWENVCAPGHKTHGRISSSSSQCLSSVRTHADLINSSLNHCRVIRFSLLAPRSTHTNSAPPILKLFISAVACAAALSAVLLKQFRVWLSSAPGYNLLSGICFHSIFSNHSRSQYLFKKFVLFEYYQFFGSWKDV
jgi:hypothetical protein